MHPVPCANCGATMVPLPDGRTYACRYCKTQVEVAVETARVAAGTTLDLDDIESFLAQLASTLSQGLAGRAKIQVDGGTVQAIEVDLDTDIFIARRSGSQVVTEHKKAARGIVLHTSSLALDHWVELLTEALAKHAGADPGAAWVLGQLSKRG